MNIVFEPGDMISEHFTYHEALYLPAYGRMANEDDGLTDQIIINLQFMFKKMDDVRDYFNRTIRVHCAYRPPAYNALVKGASDSAHMALIPAVAACDFDVEDLRCSAVVASILGLGKLEEWDLRMEDNGLDATWVHLDTKPMHKGGSRFFRPK